MAKKELSKIDSELKSAEEKVALLKRQRQEAEAEMLQSIGKTYYQLQVKKNKNVSHKDVLLSLKEELNHFKVEKLNHPPEAGN